VGGDREAPEIERFVGYYDEMAAVSAVVLVLVRAVAAAQ
jgi:hypothetical protein